MDKEELSTQSIKDKIKALRGRLKEKDVRKLDQQGVGLAVMIVSDLLGGLIIGGALGFFVQCFFHTKPFVLVLFIFLGSVAGLVNVFRHARRIEKGRN